MSAVLHLMAFQVVVEERGKLLMSWRVPTLGRLKVGRAFYDVWVAGVWATRRSVLMMPFRV